MPNIPIPQQFLNYVILLSPRQILVIVMGTSAAMFLLTKQKIAIILLLLQYILLPQLLSEHLHQSIFFTRLGIGCSICLILYLTVDHIEDAAVPITSVREGDGDTSLYSERGRPRSMGLPFCILTLVLGIFIANHLWYRYPLPPMPPELTLTGYWLMIGGIFMTLVSLDPIRIGFGLLSFMNGFAALYLFWEPGFLVTALLNVVEVLFAMGVALFAEGWLQTYITDAETEE